MSFTSVPFGCYEIGAITSRPKPNALAEPMPRVKVSWNLNYAQEGVDQQTLRKRNLLGTLEILL
jgi:hypothetical protein